MICIFEGTCIFEETRILISTISKPALLCDTLYVARREILLFRRKKISESKPSRANSGQARTTPLTSLEELQGIGYLGIRDPKALTGFTRNPKGH
jgi:hypothetical protein